VPRFLGIDSQNREILTYLEGDTGHGITSWSDAQLIDLAHLLRPIHDALAGTPFAGSRETVCHLDLAPWNTILTANRPTAFIDFDDAAPGTRADDIAYLLWTFLDLGIADVPPATQATRLRLFCDAYTEASPLDAPALRAAVLPALHRQQHRILAFRAAQQDSFSRHKRHQIRTALHWTTTHHGALADCLS
jgi:Ser/Thr protein kinase RdoA (MazF antagonist)